MIRGPSLLRRWLSLGFVMIFTITALPRDMVGFAYMWDRTSVVTPDCTAYIIQAEKDYDIPTGLLLSIALVESGRKGRPHPWTLNMSGRGFYMESREEALKKMKDRQGRVPRNTMVGCMQVSVNLHKDKFESVDQVIEPEHNIAYAAQYLRKHYKRYGNWISAVQRYHGGKKAEKQAYSCRVWHTFQSLGGNSDGLIKEPSCKVTKAADIAPDVRWQMSSYRLAAQ